MNYENWWKIYDWEMLKRAFFPRLPKRLKTVIFFIPLVLVSYAMNYFDMVMDAI